MTVRIINGDCRAVLPTFPPDSFDCVLADPPYGETSLAWDRWPEGWPALALLYPATSKWSDVFKAPQFTNDAKSRTVRRKTRPAHWGAIGNTEAGSPRGPMAGGW